MAGGLLQLVAVGQADFYFTGKPSISFFKSVYKKYTNFAMESRRISTRKSQNVNVDGSTTLIFEIKRVADLLSDIYFSFKVPDINLFNDPTCEAEFSWIENLGEMIIKNCKIFVGGNEIQSFTGEYIHIHNQLNLSMDKRRTYNKMIGNSPEFHSPKSLNQNKYPYSGNPTTNPSIPGRRLYCHLPFWFSKNKGVSLPLIALQYHDVEIHVELRPLLECYRINYTKDGVYGTYAPDPNIATHNITNFAVDQNVVTSASANLDVHLEANYIFLDDAERNFFASKSLDYLIEQIQIREFTGLTSNQILEIFLQNPVKEMIWVTKRSDQNDFNNWNNYTDFTSTQPEIFKEGRILFNGRDRIESKPSEYYNWLQPYQHHNGSPRDGIYLYSFAIEPSKFQPTGAANTSRINKIETVVELKNASGLGYDFTITFFNISLNIFRIISGMGSTAWAI